MKKGLIPFLLLLCLLLTACGPAAQPEPAPVPDPAEPEVTEPTAAEPEPDPAPELSQREKDWIEDIEFLREFSVDAYYDENGRLYPWENTILPDVYVYQDIGDIRQSRDSVLQWVLAQEK